MLCPINYLQLPICFALVFAVGLAGCSSSPGELPSKPDKYGVNEKPMQEIIDNSTKDTAGTNPDLLAADHIGGIKIGMSLGDVKKLLGEPASRDQLQNWAADGRWYATYYFPRMGLALNMGSDDSACFKPTVSSITAMSSCPFRTGRGVGIGSSLADVRNRYEALLDKEQSSDTVLLAGSLYGGLIFELEKGKVKKMFLGAAAE